MARAATLIYNANSGGAAQTSAEDLKALLGEQGYSPVYRATSSEEELDPILEDVQGLVVAVGGDGTLRAVATRLVGKDVSLAVVPLGTANNVARTLGVAGSPEEIIRGLEHPKKVAFDLGYVRSPFGEDYFLEAVGCGLFADLLYDYDPEEGKSVLRAFDTVKDVLAGYEPKRWEVSLDGKVLNGEYLGIEVLNTKATGPRLKLAPDAEPTDGLFDVVLVKPPETDKLLAYVGTLLTDSFDALENVDIMRGKKLELSWNGSPIHLDAELRPGPQAQPADATPAKGARPQPQTPSGERIGVELLPGALELWLPESS